MQFTSEESANSCIICTIVLHTVCAGSYEEDAAAKRTSKFVAMFDVHSKQTLKDLCRLLAAHPRECVPRDRRNQYTYSR
jgi:hypothetical protein